MLFALFAHAAGEIGDSTPIVFFVLAALCFVGAVSCFVGTTINLTTPEWGVTD